MQTFISDYQLDKNAANLDGKRLFKQLLEGKQILDILINKKEGSWSSHPATLQWKNFEIGLFWYLRAIWNECQKREIALDSQLFDQCYKLILKIKLGGGYIDCDENNRKVAKICLPKWWNREDILISHRSRLKAKGLIDIYCAAIKKQFKVKKLDVFLKDKFGKTKNQLRFEDVNKLDRLLALAKVDCRSFIKQNHYNFPQWSKIPYNLDYVWG